MFPIPNYFLKLIFFSLFLGIFPVATAGLFSYMNVSGTIQDKVNKGNKQFLLQTQIRIEQILKTTDQMLTQFIISPIVNKAIHSPLEPEQFDIITELSIGLNKIQTYELGINDIQIYSLSQKWIYNSEGIRWNQELPASFAPYLDSLSTSFWSKAPGSLRSVEGTGGQPQTPYINLVKKLPINTINPVGLVIAEISLREISKLMQGDQSLGSMVLLDDAYNILAYDSDSIREDQVNLLIKELRRKPEIINGQYNVRVDGQDQSITIYKSAYNGWHYLSVASVHDMTKETRDIGWISLAVCAGIIVLAGAISLLGSRKLYVPVRNLYKKAAISHDGAFVKDEFHVISERLHMLVDDTSKLNVQLESQIPQLRDYFLTKLILGTLLANEAEEKFKEFDFPAWDLVGLLAVQIDTLEHTPYTVNDKDLLMFAINNIVGELIPTDKRIDPIVIHEAQITLFGTDQASLESFKMELFDIAEQIQANVYHYLKLKLNIGISRPFRSYKLVNQAYLEAVDALHYRIRLDQEAILFFDDVQPGQPIKYRYPAQLGSALLEAVKVSDEEMVSKHLHSFMKEVFKYDMSPRAYQVSLIRLLADLIELLNEEEAQLAGLNQAGEPLFDRFFELKTADEIESWLRFKVIYPISQVLEARRVSQYQKVTDDILTIIHREYDTELTLDVCSARLNYHPNHLKRVFRQTTGVNFSDYVSQYRLGVAKKWLEETDMSVAKISEILKYNNPQNFIRYFRKHEGVTPGEYRKRLLG